MSPTGQSWLRRRRTPGGSRLSDRRRRPAARSWSRRSKGPGCVPGRGGESSNFYTSVLGTIPLGAVTPWTMLHYARYGLGLFKSYLTEKIKEIIAHKYLTNECKTLLQNINLYFSNFPRCLGAGYARSTSSYVNHGMFSTASIVEVYC